MTDTFVTTSAGTLRGTTTAGVDRFLGVPYAAAPVGPQRFRLPEPHSGWDGVRDAIEPGATAPQAPYAGGIETILPTVRIAGDEYLNMNLWVPSGPTAAPALPVMVWIHGGSLAHGANALDGYDGTAFARDGVVFVAVNYRLGSEGFSVLEGAPLNLGLADVVAALRWVRDEIAAFGGDPERVTVFGQSAGAIIIGSLLAAPEARGLFSAAILQSGIPIASKRSASGAISRLTAKALGIRASREDFADVPADELVATQQTVLAGSTPLTGGPAFAITIGGPLVPRDPAEAVLAGASDDVRLLIGSTSEEYRLWFVPTGLMEKISPLLFAAARLKFRIGRRVLAAYRAGHPGASRGELFGTLATDIILRLPLNRLADARLARGASTHVFEFTWPSPVQQLGAAHAVELPFVFDRLGSTDAIALAGPDAPQQLADDMHGAWVRFATTGDPGWQAWDASRPVQTFDTPASVIVNAPREAERAAWEGRH